MQNKMPSLDTIKWILISFFVVVVTITTITFFSVNTPNFTKPNSLEINDLTKSNSKIPTIVDFDSHVQLEYPNLKDNLLLIRHFPRQEEKSIKPFWELQFKGDSAKKKLKMQDPIYFTLNGNRLFFSNVPTSFYIICEKIVDKTASFQMKMSLPEGVDINGDSNFDLCYVPDLNPSFLNETPYDLLKKIEYFGEDLFSKIASEKTGGYLMQVGSDIISFSIKDQVIYQNGKWQKLNGKESINHPLAAIKKIEKNQIVLAIWDLKGSYAELKISQLKEEKLVLPQDAVIQNIFIRSKHHIRASFGKSIIYLREEEALFKNDEGIWRKLPRAKDNISYLIGRPFVYFDKIITENYQKFFQGYYFSSHLTAVIPIKIPITVKTSLHSKRATLKLDKLSPKRR